MVKISSNKKEKIKEHILSLLYHNSPNALFGAEIAREMIRDEEFIKKLLLEMEKQKLVTSINKNNKGISYIRRLRWRLTNNAFKAYKEADERMR